MAPPLDASMELGHTGHSDDYPYYGLENLLVELDVLEFCGHGDWL